MVRIPAGIHKKIKHTNLETAANAAYVNKGTYYWAFTIRLVTSNNVIFTTTPDIEKSLSIVYKADYLSVILATASHTKFLRHTKT